MINFLKKFFVEKETPYVREQSEIEKKVRREYATNYYAIYNFSQIIDDFLKDVMKYKYEDVITNETQYNFTIMMDGFKYELWNANYPSSWLSTLKKNGSTIMRDGMPHRETAIQFRIWVMEQKEKVEENKRISSKMDNPIWKKICSDYFKLRDNNHYSHHTVKGYMDEIIELRDNGINIVPEKELKDEIFSHFESLKKITSKALDEMNKIIEEQKERERIEEEEKKEKYKNALIESSKLLKGRYQDYCKDFGLEKSEEDNFEAIK